MNHPDFQINIETNDDKQPIHYASQSNSLELIKMIIDTKGLQVNLQSGIHFNFLKFYFVIFKSFSLCMQGWKCRYC